MKKLFSYILLSSMTFPLLGNPSKADENYFWDISSNGIYELLKSSISGESNSISVISTFNRNLNNNVILSESMAWMDNSLQKIFFTEMDSNNSVTGRVWTYSIGDDSWSVGSLTTESNATTEYHAISNNSHTNVSANTANISTNSSNISSNDTDIATNQTNIATNSTNISSNDTDIATNATNISSNDTDIARNASNISTNNSNISTNKSNINSLGEGIAGTTALTAALTALPQTSKESKLSCGVGTGAYSSRYAIGFGCASKVNERVDINAGGSYVFGGTKSYGGGTLDSGVVKAGFVFKLGELNKPNQISFNDKKIIDKKLSTLEENNKNLNAKLKLSKAKMMK